MSVEFDVVVPLSDSELYATIIHRRRMPDLVIWPDEAKATGHGEQT